MDGRRFHVHTCLGRGGFGEVYRATMSSSGGVQSEVAVKILREDIDPGSEAVKRLRDEGRLLGALRHPAILHVHDLVLLEGRVALVTEFIEGEDLDRCMTADPPLSVRALVSVVGEVASALDAAWNTETSDGDPIHLIHRDIKPANIRIGRHGEVKLLDFGIARATNLAREAQTAGNAMMGSYLYMAPERFQADEVEPPSDVYALGCVLFEGLVRRRFFEGMTLKQIYGTMLSPRKFDAHLEARFKLLDADLPDEVVDLLRTLLDADAAARPSASEAAQQCEDLAEDLTGPTLKRWCRGRTWPPQVVQGSLDGRHLSAQTFTGIDEHRSQGSPEDAPPLGHISDAVDLDRVVGTRPASAVRDLPSGVPIVDGPPPVRPAPVPEGGALSMMALPSPGAISFDAPTPGLVPLARTSAPPPAAPPAVLPPPSEVDAPQSQGGQVDRNPVSIPWSPPPSEAPAAEPEVVEAPPVRVPVEPVDPAPLGGPPPLVSADGPEALVSDPGADADASTVPRQAIPGWSADETSTLRPMNPLGLDELPPSQQETLPPARDRSMGPDGELDDIDFPGAAAYFEIDAQVTPDPIPEVFDDEAPHSNPGSGLGDSQRGDRTLIMIGGGIGAVAALALLIALAVVMGEGFLEELDLPAATEGTDGSVLGDGSTRASAGVVVPEVAPPAARGTSAGNDGGLEPSGPALVPTTPPNQDPSPRPPVRPDPAPAPAPVVAAPPAPPAPAAPDPGSLSRKGWDKVDRESWSAALDLFEEALALDGQHASSLYGKGYTLMRTGRAEEATDALCAAIRAADRGTGAEINSIMSRENLSCP